MSRCSCDDKCRPFTCEHGGIQNLETCTCDCPPQWGGDRCEIAADGKTKMRAVPSCKALLAQQANATTGLYWLNPKGVAPATNAFQSYCDMDTDGGGWVQVAHVGAKMKEGRIDKNSYLKGTGKVGMTGSKMSEFIEMCSKFDGLDGNANQPLKQVVVRVTMGEVKDYFKPVAGASLCDMLTSNDKHLWSVNGGQPPEDGDSPPANSSLMEMSGQKTSFLQMQDGGRRSKGGTVHSHRHLHREAPRVSLMEMAGSLQSALGALGSRAAGREAKEAQEKRHKAAAARKAAALPSFLDESSEMFKLVKHPAKAAASTAMRAPNWESHMMKRRPRRSLLQQGDVTGQQAAQEAADGWLQPIYEQNPMLKQVLLGGSNKTWPVEIDSRQYISFWGGDRGGCCHYYSTIFPGPNGGAADPGSWGRKFDMHIIELPASTTGVSVGKGSRRGAGGAKGPAAGGRFAEVGVELKEESAPQQTDVAAPSTRLRRRAAPARDITGQYFLPRKMVK